MKYNREEIRLNLRMLLEEEGDDSGADDLADTGDDEGAEPGSGGETPDDSGDEAADDEGDTEAEKDIEVQPHEEKSLKHPLEAQVDAVLADFEMTALKSAKVNESSLAFLLEEDAPGFDVNSFSEDVARLIQNYETLLDIESAIYYRAVSILEKNYGEDIAKAFKDIMHSRHGFDFGDVRTDPVKDLAPLAVGTGGEGGGA